jgi:capsular exopolysaccharide synthesis family protein
LVAVYTFTTPKVYESTADILVIPKDSNLPAQNVQGQLGFEQPDSAELIATHMKIICSSGIVNRALQQAELLSLPSILDRLKEDDTPVDYVIKNLTATRSGDGASVLSVAFRHTDKRDCATVLEAVIAEYQNFIRETVRGSGSEAADLISKAKDELSRKLEGAAEDYRDFRVNSPILWATGQNLNVHQIRVSEWEAALSQLKLRKLAIESRLAMVRDALHPENREKYTDLERFALIDQQDIERLKLMVEVEKGDSLSAAFQATQPVRAEVASAEYDRLVALRLEEKSLLGKGAQHPRVGEIREQIDALAGILEQQRGFLPEVVETTEVDLHKMVIAYRALLQHDFNSIERQERENLALIAGETKKAKTLVSYELREETLRQDLERTQGLYDAVLDRLREINLLKDYGGFLTKTISPVELGELVWPSLPMLGVLGLALGGLLGSATAVGMELADRSFHSEDELKSVLDLPILANLPRINVPKQKHAESTITTAMVTHHRPDSAESENVRRLRTSVCFRTAGEDGKVLQITSPLPGDGKTTISCNLAISLAQAGKRVLLLDADLRQPQTHQVFGEKLERGLSDVLAGEERVEAVVRSTSVANLDLLTAGTISPNPSEQLTMPAFPALLEKLREQYDFVVVDSPPVLSVNDSIIVGRNVDGVVLVVKLRRDSRLSAARAKAELADNGCHLYGLAINNSRLNTGSKSRYGYEFSYGQRYGDRQGRYLLKE